MQSAEIELKFAVRDLPQLEQRIRAAGFHLKTPRTFESNTLYDTDDRSLRGSGQILRIRTYGGKTIITHKRHPDDEDVRSRFKVRIETESEVEDGDAMAAIFTQLGYKPAFRYEKFRTEYLDPRCPACCVVTDETPIGNFAELEGPPQWIDQTLAALKVNPNECLTESYGKLFLAWKHDSGSPAANLTFDEIGSSVAEIRAPLAVAS